jgi:hypothetical protein
MKQQLRWPSAVILTVLLVVMGAAASSGQGTPQDFLVQIDPAEVVYGPDNRTDHAFYTVDWGDRLLAYQANQDTWGYVGGSLETLRAFDQDVIDRGTDFDSCGAWLNGIWQDGNVVRGWYHAETGCDYIGGTSKKSIAYAESYDGGRTFIKVDYPNNQVITAPANWTEADQDDEGDHYVVRAGDYLYMYFLASRDYRVHLARSHVADGGRPGTWWKYFNGAFSEPGLGGESTAISGDEPLTVSKLTHNTFLNAYLGLGHVADAGGFTGFDLLISPNGIDGWRSLHRRVLQSSSDYFARPPDSFELTEYPSFVSLYGDGAQTGQTFWLYYMYLKPGEDWQHRYLLRRRVHLSMAASADATLTTPRMALATYLSGADQWSSTTVVDPAYELDETLGYLFTQPLDQAKPVYDCYLPATNDHMLVVDDPTCGGGEVRMLGRLGWVRQAPFTGSIPVYRCWNAANNDHFMSADAACEGQTTEWLFGYLAAPTDVPPAAYVALSDYYDVQAGDNWATTRLPPQSYAFRSRLGYLFAEQQPNTVPVHDCYIPDWQDHMLVFGSGGCGDAQTLGVVGWIAQAPFPGSVAVYRCWDEVTLNHFMSLEAACTGGALEWIAGYLATETEPPPSPTATPPPSATPPATATSTPTPLARLFLPHVRE